MREAPGLLLAPLSSAACTLPPTLQPRVSAAISAFTQSLAAFLHFFKVCPVFCHFHRFQSPQHATTIDPPPFSQQSTYFPLCHTQSPSICRTVPNGAEIYAACLKVRPSSLQASRNPAANNSATPKSPSPFPPHCSTTPAWHTRRIKSMH